MKKMGKRSQGRCSPPRSLDEERERKRQRQNELGCDDPPDTPGVRYEELHPLGKKVGERKPASSPLTVRKSQPGLRKTVLMLRATEGAEPLPSPAAEPHYDEVLSPPICRRSTLFSPSPVGSRSLSRKRKNLSFASSIEVFAFSPRDSPTAFLKLRQTMRAPEPESPVVRRLDFGPEAATTTLGTRLLTALFWFGVAVAFLPFLPLRLVYASCMSALGKSPAPTSAPISPSASETSKSRRFVSAPRHRTRLEQ